MLIVQICSSPLTTIQTVDKKCVVHITKLERPTILMLCSYYYLLFDRRKLQLRMSDK